MLVLAGVDNPHHHTGRPQALQRTVEEALAPVTRGLYNLLYITADLVIYLILELPMEQTVSP